MSKSGQPAAKADTGGQRAPKSGGAGSGNEKKEPTPSTPAKKVPGKKPAT